MKVLDKDVTGTILKLSEQEIYVLTYALRHCKKTIRFEGIQEDMQSLLDVLDEAVWQQVPNPNWRAIPIMTHRMYVNDRAVDYSIEAIAEGFNIIGRLLKEEITVTITRDSELGKIIRARADIQDPSC